jgi:D-serine deaminase-like pyridoxal phosphate-dependent protein
MENIVSPSLVIDEDKCRRNIRQMASKARASGVFFRPHFKTHQSLTIGKWFKASGVDRIAVSSLSMAKYFSTDGWEDIMVAFPVNVREVDLVNELASRINLSILLADADALGLLSGNLYHKTGFYLKIDIGNNRSGYLPENIDEISHVLGLAKQNAQLEFRGFVAHAGHTYQTDSLNEVQKIYRTGVQRLSEVTAYFKKDYPGILSSWGDTPTCSLINEFPEIDEIRPGNFVFYDLMQYHLASCDWDQIAVAVAAPVVARQPDRNEVVLYCGAVHLSKDSLKISDEGLIFGEVVKMDAMGWERFPEPLYVNRMSQEHGVFYCPDEWLGNFAPGSLAGIIPVHSCLTADLLKGKFYNLKTGEFIFD